MEEEKDDFDYANFEKEAIEKLKNGKELGGTLEFRTGAELAWRFDDYSRLGLALHHISNASIYDSNPGTEMLVLTYSVPFTKAR